MRNPDFRRLGASGRTFVPVLLALGVLAVGALDPKVVRGARRDQSPAVRTFEITASRFKFDPPLLEVVEGDEVRLVLPLANDDHEVDPAQPDFAVINLPTNLRLPRHAVAFALTHRFSRPLAEGSFGDLVGDLFGFDSGAQIGLGLRFGLRAGTETAVYRTTDRAIQLAVKQDLFQQGPQAVSLGLHAAVEGRDNFGEQYSPAAAIASRKLGARAALYVLPVYVWNSAVDPAVADDDALLLGLGGRLLLGRGVALAAEWTPRLAGYAPPDAVDPRRSAAQPLSFEIEKRVGGHAFQLNFSNGFGTTYTSLARGASRDDWFIGFNLSRKVY